MSRRARERNQKPRTEKERSDTYRKKMKDAGYEQISLWLSEGAARRLKLLQGELTLNGDLSTNPRQSSRPGRRYSQSDIVERALNALARRCLPVADWDELDYINEMTFKDQLNLSFVEDLLEDSLRSNEALAREVKALRTEKLDREYCYVNVRSLLKEIIWRMPRTHRDPDVAEHEFEHILRHTPIFYRGAIERMWGKLKREATKHTQTD